MWYHESKITMLKGTPKKPHRWSFIYFFQAIRAIFQVETILVPFLACGTNVVLLFKLKLAPLDALFDKNSKNLYIALFICYRCQVILKKASFVTPSPYFFWKIKN